MIWESVVKKVKEKTTKASFDMWFKTIKFIGCNDKVAMIQVTSQTEKDWIISNFSKLLIDNFYEVTGENYKINVVSEKELPLQTEEIAIPYSEKLEYTTLLEKYTFDQFVIGESNRFAHAACFAVAGDPGDSYNPLFIHGGSGLGKTHLMQAIGHAVRERQPDAQVVYISSEKFLNQFITSISENKMDAFRNKYRQADVLLIDDIQFLMKKDKTQEEFFHTFNELHEAGKQIVISSDKPPAEIKGLEDRMRSRFVWGLITEIYAPDLETRVAILQKKSNSNQLDIPYDVLTYISNSIDSNVRELEGALTRVLAYSSLHNRDIDLELATEALKNLLPSRGSKVVSIFDIQKVVASHFQVSIEDFKSKSRAKTIAHPRQIAMYLARDMIGSSFPKIGEAFGGRDHTTVMHATQKITKQIEDDQYLKNQIDNIKKNLNSFH